MLYNSHSKDWVVQFMVFNATFNNISVISWRSVLLVEETGVPENCDFVIGLGTNISLFVTDLKSK
jgi:hypothetical protein